MPPKKPGLKAKKEEVEVVPKASTLPDGKKTYFIGGWSKHAHLDAIKDIVTADSTCDAVFVLPGRLGSEGADAAAPTRDVAVRSMRIVGLVPAIRAKNAAAAAAATVGAGGGGDGGAEDGKGGEGGEAGEGDGGEDGGEGAASAKAAAAGPKVAVADRSVAVCGPVAFVALPPPVVPAPPAALVASAAPAAVVAPAAAAKGGKAKPVVEDPAEVAARAAAAAAAAAAAKAAAEKGFAAPSRWPHLVIENMFFAAAVMVKGIHATFLNCHFFGSRNQVEVHQYCKVTFERCSFAAPGNAGLYAFPLSEVVVKSCAFLGSALPETESDRSEAAAAAERSADGGAGETQWNANSNNAGVSVDDASVVIRDCSFSELGTAVVVRNKSAGTTIEKNTIARMANTGLFLEDTQANATANTVSGCAYYGVRFVGRCTGQFLKNVVSDRAVIGEGARPLLHSNKFSHALEDRNDKGSAALQPRY